MNRFNPNNDCPNITRLEKVIANLKRKIVHLERRIGKLELTLTKEGK